MLRYAFCVVLLCGFSKQQEYEVPPATVEILHPKGFTVSIPDQEGIKLFAFHGKINEDFDGLEAGMFARDITRPQNGKWTFRESSQRFKPGDVIYYWLYVDYFDGKNKLGYRRENQKYVVNEIPKNNADKNKGNQGNQGGGGGGVPVPPPTCTFSPSTVNGESTCSGKVIFEENFDGIAEHVWQTEIKFADDPDFEFVLYSPDRTNLYAENGQLHIKPTFADDKYGAGFVTIPGGLDLGLGCTSTNPDECKRKPAAFLILPPVLSGRINTKPSFSFRYGRIDVRAKLPKGDWIYPELFLTPKKFEYGVGEYASGQIRIAFLPGNANMDKELEGGILLGTSDEARQYGLRKSTSHISWSDDFHVFSAVWKSDSIQLLVDNKAYANIYPPPGGFANVATMYNPEAAAKWKAGEPIAPFDKEMLITVGVGVGGHSFPDSIPDKPYSNIDGKAQSHFYKIRTKWLSTWSDDSQLVVDYIKVYAI